MIISGKVSCTVQALLLLVKSTCLIIRSLCIYVLLLSSLSRIADAHGGLVFHVEPFQSHNVMLIERDAGKDWANGDAVGGSLSSGRKITHTCLNPQKFYKKGGLMAEQYLTGEVHVRDDNKLIVVKQSVGVDVGRTEMQLKCADAIHDVMAKWLDSKAGQVIVDEDTFREFHDQHWADIDCAIWNFEEDIVTSGELPCDKEE